MENIENKVQNVENTEETEIKSADESVEKVEMPEVTVTVSADKNTVTYEITSDEENGDPEEEIEALKAQIELRATNFVKAQIAELDYDSEGEVALYAGNPKSQWHDEAVALQNWIENVYSKMYDLEDSLTVDNYKDVNLDEMEAEYPKFSVDTFSNDEKSEKVVKTEVEVELTKDVEPLS